MKFLSALLAALPLSLLAAKKPNLVLIYADDLGFGDVSINGATAVSTPNIDRIAKEGINFTAAYCTSATCTPSRFSLLTGKYAFRQRGTGILPGDAALIIDPALVSQIDFAKTFAAIAGVEAGFPDSLDQRAALLGESETGRDHVIQQAGSLSIRMGDWKFIPGGKGLRMNANTGTELGNAPEDQLYDLSKDPGETKNLAKEQPEKAKELAAKLVAVRG